MMRGDRAEAYRIASEAVRASPDDWETLQDLFLYLWSWSYLDGRPYSEVARVVDRMQQARTADREAWNTNDSYFVAGEYERAREVIEDQLAHGAIFDEKVRLRSRFAIALVTGDEATRAAILKELPEQVPVVGKGFSPGFRQFFMSAVLVPGGIGSAEEIVRLASDRDHAVGVDLGLNLSLVRGRLAAARKLAAEAAAIVPENATSYGVPSISADDRRWAQLFATGFSEEMAEIGATPDVAQLTSDRQALLAFALDAKDGLFVRVMRTFMLGRFSALLGDAQEAERWASELERMVPPPNGSIGGDLALWIRATIAWKAGRLDDALRLIEAVRAQLPGENNSFGFRVWINPHVWLPINYGRAELLFRLGRYDEAERWWLTSIRHSGREFRAQRFRRLGQIAARRGDKAKAVAYLSHFVEMWGDCDPDLQPQVDEARTLLATLR
jgi:tetratricopeptide (TPR) repeat protein